MYKQKIFIVTLISLFLVSCEQNNGYKQNFSIGKDTIKNFGDGTFQVVRSGDGISKVLINNRDKRKRMIEAFVMDYKQLNHQVYVIGLEQGFTILDLKTFEYQQTNEVEVYYNLFTENQRQVFLSILVD